MSGFTHENLPGNFDGVTFVNRDIAALDDTLITIGDGRLPLHPWFSINIACWPSANDTFNNRPRLTFNNDAANHYEASFRAFVNTSDTPPATEAPAIAHLKDQAFFPLLPPDSNFDLTAVDICFAARIDVMQLDQPYKYRIFSHWSRGASSASTHPRHGLMVGNWNGTAGGGIISIQLKLGASGKFAAGCYMEGYSMQSSILGAGYVYKEAKLPTGKVWVDGRPVWRYVMTDLSLPAPAASTSHILPIGGFDVTTARLVEVWAYKTSPSHESVRLRDMGIKFSTTQLTFTSPSGGTDYSAYVAHAVWEFCDPA